MCVLFIVEIKKKCALKIQINLNEFYLIYQVGAFIKKVKIPVYFKDISPLVKCFICRLRVTRKRVMKEWEAC